MPLLFALSQLRKIKESTWPALCRLWQERIVFILSNNPSDLIPTRTLPCLISCSFETHWIAFWNNHRVHIWLASSSSSPTTQPIGLSTFQCYRIQMDFRKLSARGSHRGDDLWGCNWRERGNDMANSTFISPQSRSKAIYISWDVLCSDGVQPGVGWRNH